MSMKCILIKIKFDIDINNDELLKTISKQKKKKKKLIIVGGAQNTKVKLKKSKIYNLLKCKEGA